MNNTKTRAFLAIDIDKKLIPPIKNIQEEFKKTNTNIKYVEIKNIHLTLKFFGNINEKMIDKISIATENTLKKYNSLKINIKGTGTFPNENHIKVIWIGITKNPILNNLQHELDEEFEKLGFKKEKNYSHHLTIGRMKSPKNKEEIKEKLNTFKNTKIGEMKIREISLKKSELTPNGPIYSNIKTFTI